MAGYRELIVWQRGMLLAETVYEFTSRFPKEEIFGLTSQIRRASVSVPSNIAEGYGRGTMRELVHFLRIARGSAAEAETQIILSTRLSFAAPQEAEILAQQYRELQRMIGSLILKLEKKNNL